MYLLSWFINLGAPVAKIRVKLTFKIQILNIIENNIKKRVQLMAEPHFLENTFIVCNL